MNGTLAMSLAGGATISAGANNSATLTLSDLRKAQINATLATLSYQGSVNFNGSRHLDGARPRTGTRCHRHGHGHHHGHSGRMTCRSTRYRPRRR